MPEKRYKKGCGGKCLGCWLNNMRHGCPEAKKYLQKHPELEFEVIGDERKSVTEMEQEKRKITATRKEERPLIIP
jgi:hypothetical protein